MDSRRALSIVLSIVGIACRVLAIAMCAVTAILCFSGIAAQLGIVGLVVDLSRSLPGAIAGYGVVATPFGGVFRLDFALVAVFLFAIDYACARASRALR